MILEALLFIIYINDIENVIEKCKIVLYADDTVIFAECTTCKECYGKIGKDMDNINKWLKINKLKLNENEARLMGINMHTKSSFGRNM